MKILILNWRDPRHPLAGGAEQSLHEHVKYWVKKGAEVTWFASSWPKAKKEDKIGEIRIIRAGSHFTVHLIFALRWLTSGINKDFEVIVDCFHFLPFFTPIFIKRKFVVSFTHEVAGNLWYKNIIYPLAISGSLIEKFSYVLYKKIKFIVVSESTKEELVREGIPSKNIAIIYNGVTLPAKIRKVKKEAHPTIIYCGRITKDKGIEDALKAFSNIKTKAENVKLWIVGGEERPGYLNNLLSSYTSESESIEYFGFVPEKKKFELLARAWVLIHPSMREGWGLNVIEANAVGTPAVGYDTSGLRDSIRDKRTGLLADTDPESLAEKILILLNDKKRLTQYSKNAVEYSKKFSWEEAGSKSWKLISND